MKHVIAAALSLALAVALSSPARASFTPQATAVPGSAPQGINYQGRLEDNGFPATGSKSMVFRVYDSLAGGNLLWTSPAQAVDVQIGLFNAVVPVPITALVGGGSRYLEVQIDGTVMSPRELLNSVPYALIAKSVEGTIDVSTSGLTVLANSGASSPSLYVSSQSGNVGVGTANPAAAFDVDGAVQFGAGAAKSTFTAAGDLQVARDLSARNVVFSSAMVTGDSFTVGGATLAARGGNVGVGTLSAQAKLDVVQAASGSNIARFENSGSANVVTLTSTGRFSHLSGGVDGRYVLGPNAALDAGVTAQDYAGIELGSSGLYSAITSGGSTLNGGVRELYFFTNNDFSAAKLMITSAGRVGISTQAPSAQLDVNGDAQFGAGAAKSTFTAAGALRVAAGLQVGGNTGLGAANPASKLHLSSGTIIVDGNSADSLLATGRVGLGTANPADKLHVSTGGIVVDGNATVSLLATGRVGLGTSNPADKLHLSSGTVVIDGNAATALTTTGSVGVGTASPQSTLQVVGNYMQIPTTTGADPLAADCDAAAEAGRMVVRTDGAGGTTLWVCKGAGGWQGF